MERQKRILAIHDISCVGRCSLTVALPILSSCGHDTSVLPTAILSTHTGEFENFTYRDLTDDLESIANHWESLDIKFDAIYTGFLGSYKQIDIVQKIIDKFRTPETIVMVDPVMADNGELYSTYTKEMKQGMKKLCKDADIILPNLTEAAFLLDQDYVGDDYNEEYVKNTLKSLSDLGAKNIILTGITLDGKSFGAASYDSQRDKFSFSMNERVDGFFYGTGDIFASSLLGMLLNDESLDTATDLATEFTLQSIKEAKKLNQERRYGVCFERILHLLTDYSNKNNKVFD